LAATPKRTPLAILASLAATTGISLVLCCVSLALTFLPLRGDSKPHLDGGPDVVFLVAALLGSLAVALGRRPADAPLDRRSTALLVGALVPAAAGFIECLQFMATSSDVLCGQGFRLGEGFRLIDVVREVFYRSDESLDCVRAGALQSGLLLLVASSFRAGGPDAWRAGRLVSLVRRGGAPVLMATAARVTVLVSGVHLGRVDLVGAVALVVAVVVVIETPQRAHSWLPTVIAAVAAACLFDLGARTGATCALLRSLESPSLSPNQHLQVALEAIRTQSARGSLALVDAAALTLLVLLIHRWRERSTPELGCAMEQLGAIAVMVGAVVVAATPLQWSGVAARVESLDAFFLELSSPGDLGPSLDLGSWRVPSALRSPLVIDRSGTLHTPTPPTLACPADGREEPPSVVIPAELSVARVLEALRTVAPSSVAGKRPFRFLRVRPDRAPAPELGSFGPLEQLVASAIADVAIEIDPDPVFLGTPTRPNQGIFRGVVLEGTEDRLYVFGADPDGYHVAESGMPVTIEALAKGEVIDWPPPDSKWKCDPRGCCPAPLASVKVERMLVVPGTARVDGVEAIAERLGSPITVAVSPEAVERAVAVATTQRARDVATMQRALEAAPAVAPEVRMAGPIGVVTIGALTSDPPALEHAASAVAGLKAGFRSCYNAGLNADPTMSGRLVVNVTLSPNGEVAAADVSGNTGLSDAVVQCVLRKARNADFRPPGPGGARISSPVTFTQSDG